ncbi:MAG: hypothetical protein EOP48_34115, partial [Sphingobacteriales bacterium]
MIKASLLDSALETEEIEKRAELKRYLGNIRIITLISEAEEMIKKNKTRTLELAEKIFNRVDENLQVTVLIQDGSMIKKGDIALKVKGSVHSILKAERLVLNCMQRMSGIATLTREITEIIKDTGARLLDTRKTTPNFRMPEKWAVVIGGGTNHRYGLFDMILLKDNHVDYAGGVSKAIFS